MRIRVFSFFALAITISVSAGAQSTSSDSLQNQASRASDVSSSRSDNLQGDRRGVDSTRSNSARSLVESMKSANRFAPAPADPKAIPDPPRMYGSNGVALMVVGGVAMIVGSAVGGNDGHLILVGGAIIGLVGLYQYLR
jgi:hypothetical protein